MNDFEQFTLALSTWSSGSKIWHFRGRSCIYLFKFSRFFSGDLLSSLPLIKMQFFQYWIYLKTSCCLNIIVFITQVNYVLDRTLERCMWYRCLCFFPSYRIFLSLKRQSIVPLSSSFSPSLTFSFPASILKFSVLSLATVLLWFFSEPLNTLKRQKITQVEFCCHFSKCYLPSEGLNANTHWRGWNTGTIFND